MKKTPLTVGQAVVSRAGRDEGRMFLVLALSGEYALVADGALRKVGKPKKKKIRHLKPVAWPAEAAAARLAAGEKVEDYEVREWLSAIVPHEEG
ncbi:MAG: RNA-binding protein [Clostridiales bacterium]|nr:RNA-binding protein [Clostridiales bacterium]